MILKDSYKTYVVEEKGDNTISIKKIMMNINMMC